MAQKPVSVLVEVYRKADGTADYFVSLRCEDRLINLFKFNERWKADYHAAEIDHVILGLRKPQLEDFDPEIIVRRELGT
jgi:hypothetical protein